MIHPHTPEWRAARAQTVGASEVAALYGCHPHLSHWTLWHVKAGRIPPPEVSGPRPAWGLRLEDAIAAAVAETRGWDVERAAWQRDPSGLRLSCTPDFIARAPDRDGPGLVECKNVDWLIHKRAWTEGEPPMHIVLQLQAQLAVTGYAWGTVAALVGGNELRLYDYAPRPTVIADIRKRVAAFWRSIAEDRPPPVDGSDSTADALRALYPETREEMLDLRESNRAPEVCAALLAATERRKAAEKEEAALKAELLAMLGVHRAAMVFGYSVRVAVTPAKPETVITPEMVGQTLPGRKESRRLTVSVFEPKEKAV